MDFHGLSQYYFEFVFRSHTMLRNYLKKAQYNSPDGTIYLSGNGNLPTRNS